MLTVVAEAIALMHTHQDVSNYILIHSHVDPTQRAFLLKISPQNSNFILNLRFLIKTDPEL